MAGFSFRARKHSLALFLVVFIILLLAGCAQETGHASAIHLHMDGTDRILTTEAPTVRVLFEQQAITLAELDRVEPPLWTPLVSGLAITVTRVFEESAQVPITHTVRIMRDEFLPPSEGRTLQEGYDGIQEQQYYVLYDGPHIVGRELVATRVLASPQEGVILQGTQGTLMSVPVSGTIVYLAYGDAWSMTGASGEKRRLTEDAGLDGRALSLAPNGRDLLYTALRPDAESANVLWALDVGVLNSSPRQLRLDNILWAEWHPDGTRLAYATLKPTEGEPGWRALNDLYLTTAASLDGTASLQARSLVSPTSSLLYAWWGERWRWSPDGYRLFSVRPDSLGLLDLTTGRRQTIYTFAPLAEQEGGVWLPQVAPSPSGREWAALVVQGAKVSLLFFDGNTGESVRLLDDLPSDTLLAWSPDGGTLAVGGGQSGDGHWCMLLHSPMWDVTTLDLTELGDGDWGSLLWSPDSRYLLVLVAGDLYRIDPTLQMIDPLTASGLVTRVTWR